MKRCDACAKVFADESNTCPADGTTLTLVLDALPTTSFFVTNKPPAAVDPKSSNQFVATKRGDFSLTMIGEVGLAPRLIAEVAFVIAQLEQAWPAFQRDPISEISRALKVIATRCRQLLLAPNVLAGAGTALAVILSAFLALLFLGPGARTSDRVADIYEPVEFISLIPLDQLPAPDSSGVGVGSKGRVGLASGKGEGSKPQPQPAHGGGGSGDHNPLPVVRGAVPPPAVLSAPINPPLPKAALPVAGTDIDPALWKSLPFSTYGDPLAKSAVASKGPGDGGANGSGHGLGTGPGDGNGVGRGNDGNMGGGPKAPSGGGIGGSDGDKPRDPNYIFPTREVSQRAKVISKPEAGYTEEARKLDITGTVVLRAVFSLSGEVIGIRAIKPLPGGLTERAIAAARQIRFVPAMKNGQPVSCYMQLEYNFNLY
jgi:TonB family protein